MSPHMKHASSIRSLAAVLLVMLLAACSFKTLYNRLDVLIPEYVEGLVTLDDALEQNLKLRSTALLEWHRKTQLFQYVGWLQAFQGEVGELTEASARQYTDEAELFWEAMSARIDNDMAELLPLLAAEQQVELFENISDKNEDFVEEHINIDEVERRDNYYERTRDTFERWIGGLTDRQAQAIRRATDGLLDASILRLERREEWQAGIREILDSHEGRQLKASLLHAYLEKFEFSKVQQLDRKTSFNKEIIIKLTVAISDSMTDEQQAHFIDKTDDYIRILTELSENR